MIMHKNVNIFTPSLKGDMWRKPRLFESWFEKTVLRNMSPFRAGVIQRGAGITPAPLNATRVG